FLELHRAYRQSHERLASLDEALGREDAAPLASPWEEVRDFFHYCDNYIDAVDRAAERFATPDGRPADPVARAVEVMASRGIEVAFADAPALRAAEAGRLTVSTRAAAP